LADLFEMHDDARICKL